MKFGSRPRTIGADHVNDDHDIVTVVTRTGKNAVLVAESDWNSIQEALYILSTRGGVRLLESAQDARRSDTAVHELIDPDPALYNTRAEMDRLLDVLSRVVRASSG